MDESDPSKQLTWAVPPLKRGGSGALPEKIGPYQIEKLLVKGGMSLIYLGVHPETHERVIVKVVQPKYLKNGEMVARLLKEAQILRLIDHPGIVKLLDLGRWEQGVFLAMEYVEGVPLRQFMHKEKLGHRRALEIILQIGKALEHLHSHGIVHRDLKPENILVTPSGAIKLIDFGIAHFLRGDGAWERSGTPGYMSPEQKEHPERVSFGSDIYALGLIAYELYLGKVSYGVVYPSLLPKPLRLIIEKALEPHPEMRYKKVAGFLADVSHFLNSYETAVQEGEDSFGVEELRQMRALFVPKEAPPWPEAEIGVACQDGGVFQMPYLDFFLLPNNQMGIILAEMREAATLAPLFIAEFRGMARALAMQMKNSDPSLWMEAFNQALLEDPFHQQINCSFLLLQPEVERLWFIACGKGSLIEWVEATSEPNLFDNAAPALGERPVLNILKGEESWPIGSTLIFSLAHLDPARLPEDMLLAPEPLAAEILAKQENEPLKTVPLLVIRRI